MSLACRTWHPASAAAAIRAWSSAVGSGLNPPAARYADARMPRFAPCTCGCGPSPDSYILFWSLSFAVRAELWRELGGLCEQYSGYGGEDTDFGQLAASHRIPLTWVGGAWAYHQHHPGADPPVQHVGDIIRNASVFYQRWGWWPMGGWLAEFERRGLIVFEHSTQTWQAVSA